MQMIAETATAICYYIKLFRLRLSFKLSTFNLQYITYKARALNETESADIFLPDLRSQFHLVDCTFTSYFYELLLYSNPALSLVTGDCLLYLYDQEYYLCDKIIKDQHFIPCNHKKNNLHE